VRDKTPGRTIRRVRQTGNMGRHRPRGCRDSMRREWPHPFAVVMVAAVPLAAVSADAMALADEMPGERDGGLGAVATDALGRLETGGGDGSGGGWLPRMIPTLLHVRTGAHGCRSRPPPPMGSAVCLLDVECHLAVAFGPVKRHRGARRGRLPRSRRLHRPTARQWRPHHSGPARPPYFLRPASSPASRRD